MRGGPFTRAVERFIGTGLQGADLVEAVRRLEIYEGAPRSGCTPRASLAMQYSRAIEAIAAGRIPPNAKRALLRRCVAAFGRRCQYCLKHGSPSTGPDGKPWNVDRIFPGALGGRYDDDNVTLACRACNVAKRALVYNRPPLSLAAAEAIANGRAA